jgi:hypothetical protein
VNRSDRSLLALASDADSVRLPLPDAASAEGWFRCAECGDDRVEHRGGVAGAGGSHIDRPIARVMIGADETPIDWKRLVLTSREDAGDEAKDMGLKN